jgi:heterodisulfide reductase subunit C
MSSPVLKFDPKLSKPLLEEVMERSGQNLLACYQCRRCAAGCPVADETGVTPDRLIRMILLGDKDTALSNLLVWECVACYTCGTRCPNNIQTARINETLKQMAKEAHLEPLTPKVAFFHDAFVTAATKSGRLNELEFMGLYEMKSLKDEASKGGLKGIFKELTNQGKLGLSMMKKKRMHVGFEKVKNLSEVKGLSKKAKARRGAE